LVLAGRQIMPKSLEFECCPAAGGERISQQHLEGDNHGLPPEALIAADNQHQGRLADILNRSRMTRLAAKGSNESGTPALMREPTAP
jgi:hypothetical protein